MVKKLKTSLTNVLLNDAKVQCLYFLSVVHVSRLQEKKIKKRDTKKHEHSAHFSSFYATAKLIKIAR